MTETGKGPAQQSAQFGGSGGEPFDDRIPDGARICEVAIRHGEYIDGIRISYIAADGTRVDCPYRGGQGGDETIVTIDAGQTLWPADLQAGDYVDALGFSIKAVAPTREQGPDDVVRFVDTMGGNGGKRYLDQDIIYVDFTAFPDGGGEAELIGIFGRSGDLLDAIGFWYRVNDVARGPFRWPWDQPPEG